MLQIFPSLERALPGVLIQVLVLEPFIRHAGPHGSACCRPAEHAGWARNHSRKDPVKLIDAIFTALGEQSVTVAGAEAVELVIPRIAGQIIEDGCTIGRPWPKKSKNFLMASLVPGS
ncbi:hypothetical protein [Paenarthrobacter sp. PH39-S1]|uniref:hypothetical protein n=1 Tax=Paenarthrobacter sp. PH39-S1 TaxID=3046204 RepID=UPI0024BAAF19|nr:hypothetical protein [Paenarthrobacter sp. PH39-S1]